ncbi:uroporphyrinogen-III C-methyltransferase [Aeromonas jandaei]|uniref:siroheme synthase CysG n=1 Tax=Aeromonas jandaei TaxID=650 RepID=UPI0019345C37|nr:siroheme synthase CysG [Aeromonas jandaei]MBM0493104.1 uroporphyrinogen-III C-methyltransferase [Aeromonas jandaei]MBM0569862.1 uroporphyrinogen-III C-methyltransferase [Aeromonas jandaei]
MDYLPMFAKLDGRPVLLVGGGEVALRKARLLLAAGARLTIVSPELEPEFTEFSGRFTHLAERFTPAHLAGQILVVAATDNLEVNALVYQSANQLGLFVNVVDDPKRSSFIFPSIIDRSPLMVAVSSGGKAPVLVRLLRERLESLLPRHLGGLTELSGRVRDKAKRVLSSISDRRRFWERAFASNTLASLIEKEDWQGAEQWLSDGLDQAKSEVGEVVLVGAGPGDPGLLTLKALQQIQQAEVVLYDQLVSAEILDLVRRDATLVSVGKKAGAHSVPQEETNRLLVEYARAGNRVVRLKGGDPFMFGRGGEELEVLADEGIPFSVVPGITAAAGATAYAGIPLTHRDYAQSAVFITGHCQKEGKEPDWQQLAATSQTLVIYMGLMRSEHIQQQLVDHGRSQATPIAIIDRGTTARQRVLTGTLADLAELAKQAVSPSLIVIGEVVALRDRLAWFGEKSGEKSGKQQRANPDLDGCDLKLVQLA